jgi:hypothetical protein
MRERKGGGRKERGERQICTEAEGEREREAERQRETETDRERQRETATETETERERKRGTETRRRERKRGGGGRGLKHQHDASFIDLEHLYFDHGNDALPRLSPVLVHGQMLCFSFCVIVLQHHLRHSSRDDQGLFLSAQARLRSGGKTCIEEASALLCQHCVQLYRNRPSRHVTATGPPATAAEMLGWAQNFAVL